MSGSTTFDRRLSATEADVEALAKLLLPKSAPADPGDPEVWIRWLTCEELSRLEDLCGRAAGDPALEAGACDAWRDAERRAVSRMLMNIDMRALDDQESASRVLVRIPAGEPPGRTTLVCYMADQTAPDQWHIESAYRGRLPRTMTTAELLKHEPQPWPPR